MIHNSAGRSNRKTDDLEHCFARGEELCRELEALEAL